MTADPNLPAIDEKADEAVSVIMGELGGAATSIRSTLPGPRVGNGWIGGKEIALADEEIAARNENATVAA